jgi:hypothetical protein
VTIRAPRALPVGRLDAQKREVIISRPLSPIVKNPPN